MYVMYVYENTPESMISPSYKPFFVFIRPSFFVFRLALWVELWPFVIVSRIKSLIGVHKTLVTKVAWSNNLLIKLKMWVCVDWMSLPCPLPVVIIEECYFFGTVKLQPGALEVQQSYDGAVYMNGYEVFICFFIQQYTFAGLSRSCFQLAVIRTNYGLLKKFCCKPITWCAIPTSGCCFKGPGKF